MKKYLRLDLLTPDRLRREEDGRRLLAFINEHLPAASPEVFGNYEPLRRPFETVEAALEYWKVPFLWKRKRPKAEGSIWFDNPGFHSDVGVECEWRADFEEQFKNALLLGSKLLRCDFGYLHLVSPDELEGAASGGPVHRVALGLTTTDLEKGIPMLCWGMYFGAAYAGLINPDRLRLPEGAHWSRTGDASCYLQLTPKLSDILEDYPAFDALRTEVRRQIGDDLFWGRSGERARRVPDFILPP